MKRFGLFFVLVLSLFVCVGCSKDTVLGYYKEINEKLGDTVLTNKRKLEGTRKFGDTHYTGTYNVTYKNFSGEEVLFGGTTIENEKNEIHIKIDVKDSLGDLNIFMRLKEDDFLLASEDGSYEFDFSVHDGSNYLVIDGDNYSGKVDIKID